MHEQADKQDGLQTAGIGRAPQFHRGRPYMLAAMSAQLHNPSARNITLHTIVDIYGLA